MLFPALIPLAGSVSYTLNAMQCNEMQYLVVNPEEPKMFSHDCSHANQDDVVPVI